MLLSAVIQVATGMSAADYARERLFAPLGITKVDWWQSTEGHTLTFCCIDMATRDFARFGLLFARGGNWAGKQLISAPWISDSLSPSPARSGYGYQWWLLGKMDQEGPPDSTPPEPSTLPPDTFAAIGVDEQLIYVVPQFDLVVVRNGTYNKDAAKPVADGGLFWHIPPQGLNASLGTRAPSSWRNDDFLHLVLAAVTR
jgi:CubicO group peptidase (beta-lactamase class C family)